MEIQFRPKVSIGMMAISKSVQRRILVPPRRRDREVDMDSDLLIPFQSVSVADVSDLVGCFYTMDPGIKPLFEVDGATAGFALTVKARPGDNLAIHGGLCLAQKNDFLVIDWLGYHDGGGSGSQVLTAPKERGIAGVVIDGCWRDVEEVKNTGVPVFGRGVASLAPMKREPGEINVPINCGGIIVEAGDIVMADAAGVVVVPSRHAREVAMTLAEDLEISASSSNESLKNDVKKSAALWSAYSDEFDARVGLRS